MDERILRQRARENLQDNWPLSIGVAAVAALLGGLLVGAGFLPEIEYTLSRDLTFGQAFREATKVTLRSGGLFSLAAFIIGGVLELGYARFLLNQHDGKPIAFNDLFSQFDRFSAGFVQHFLRTLYVSLWSLLLIIPGIIADYSYALTPYLMVDHPDLTPSQAIALSKKMMDGHKGDLFVGWILLGILTANLGNLAINPYRNAARTAFYREVKREYEHRISEW